MKFLFASDSFKGSLTSSQIITLLTRAANDVFDSCECKGIPVADGGEETVTAVVKATGGHKVSAEVHDPLMNEINVEYGVFGDKAIIEMAAASGLPLVQKELRNPMNTTTYGTGELIRHALDSGYRDISAAIGGSATNDGGMGCMRALGVRFLDDTGNDLAGVGGDLWHVSRIDTSSIDKRLYDCNFTVMCDVTNPLCGENGATYTFARQKGAHGTTLDMLEYGMQNYRDVIKRQFGIDCDTVRGAGAAGGLGAALSVFCGGKMRSGIETVLDLIGFDKHLSGVDFIITGEGRADSQSVCGKVMQGVGLRAKAHNIPAIGICGSLGEGADALYGCGITSLKTIMEPDMTLEYAIENAEKLYYEAAVKLFQAIQNGREL